LVAGIILSAVRDAFTLAHPVERADAKTLIAALGGTTIYVAGDLLFKWTIVGRISYSHQTSIAALGAVAFFTDYVTPG
jgi:low temperature requirement protein LtrA